MAGSSGILVHGVPVVAHAIEAWAQGLGSLARAVVPVLANGMLGIVAGAVVLAVVSLVKKLLPVKAAA